MRTISFGIILATALAGAACAGRAPESRVKSVEAKVDGITCPTCVPPLKASLAHEYAASTIDVDDDKDTAKVRFAEHDAFSAPAFNKAVERVLNMRVVTLRMQACGTIDVSNGQKWLTAGANRFLLKSDRDLPSAGAVCADGMLDSHSDPPVYQVSAFSTQGTESQ